MSSCKKSLKDRFFRALVLGELGELERLSPDVCGVVVSLQAFKRYFSDIKSQYVNSFMPAATFEPGQFRPTHTKFLFRLVKGVYLVHSDVLVAYMRKMLEDGELNVYDITSGRQDNDDNAIREPELRDMYTSGM